MYAIEAPLIIADGFYKRKAAETKNPVTCNRRERAQSSGKIKRKDLLLVDDKRYEASKADELHGTTPAPPSNVIPQARE
jgi:hypothetical protein